MGGALDGGVSTTQTHLDDYVLLSGLSGHTL